MPAWQGLKHRSTHSFAQVAFPLRHTNTCWEMFSSLLHPLHISASLSSAALISSRDQLSDVLLSHFQSVMLKLEASDIMMSMNANMNTFRFYHTIIL